MVGNMGLIQVFHWTTESRFLTVTLSALRIKHRYYECQQYLDS